RNASELKALIQELNSRKQWFSENGISIDSLGILKYLTVNDQLSKNIVKDTETTVKHIENLIDVAKQATDAQEKITKLITGASVTDTEGALDLLKKVTSVKNPSIMGRQKLDGVLMLDNQRTSFNISPLKSTAGIDMKEWENIGYYIANDMGDLKHNTKATKFGRIPAWLLGFSLAGHGGRIVAGTIGLGSVAAAVLIIGYGIYGGNVASQALNDRKKAK